MNNGSFDDGTLFGTRGAQSEWERSQIINSGNSPTPVQQGQSGGYFAPVAAQDFNTQYQSAPYTGGASGGDSPAAGAMAFFLMFSLLWLFDFFGRFGAEDTLRAFGTQTGIQLAVLGVVIAMACLTPAVIGWPVALCLLGADLAIAVPHQAPWLFKAPLVLPWTPVWVFDAFMILLRVGLLLGGVRMMRTSRVYRA